MSEEGKLFRTLDELGGGHMVQRYLRDEDAPPVGLVVVARDQEFIVFIEKAIELWDEWAESADEDAPVPDPLLVHPGA